MAGPATVKSAGAVHFLLNGVPHAVEGVAPTTTVLCYLREHLGLMGTKEGCAEGDCGACTVAVAELDAEDGLRLRPLNACIQLLPSLDRKALFTVEGLKQGDRLHPVQQAMLRSHASQCGFCTPGFVMSLFVLMKTSADPDRQQICDALAGNLCRCTGYRPIIEAAARMYELAAAATPDDWLTRAGTDAAGSGSWLKQALRDLRQPTSLEIAHEGTHYVAPRTIGELAALVARHPTARLVAGATDAGLLVTKALMSLPFVISVTEVEELQHVEVTDDSVVIGAAVSVADAFSALMQDYPHLDDMRRRFSGPGIRAAATLVGNIVNASPVGDWAPILLALAAVVVLRHGGDVRELPLEQFFLGYRRTALRSGEFVQAVRVPRPRAPLFFRCYKVAKHFDQDIAAVSCGLYLEVDAGRVRTIRVAYGGVDAIPRRAERCESALQDREWNEDTIEAACVALQGDFDPISDLRGTRDYRLMVTANLLRRFYFDSTATTRPMTVWTFGERGP